MVKRATRHSKYPKRLVCPYCEKTLLPPRGKARSSKYAQYVQKMWKTKAIQRLKTSQEKFKKCAELWAKEKQKKS